MKNLYPLTSHDTPEELSKLNMIERNFIPLNVKYGCMRTTKHDLKVSKSTVTVVESNSEHYQQLSRPFKKDQLNMILTSKSKDGDLF